MICNGVRWCGCEVLICGSGFWVVMVQWRHGAMVVAGYLILRGVMVMETMPMEAWRLASDGF